MLYIYISNLFNTRISFGNVIYIKREQLKTVEFLEMSKKNSKDNFNFDFSPTSKYDFTNIRSLSKIL